MAKLDDMVTLDIESFFQYVQSISYGYQDSFGKIHLGDDKDFAVRNYSLSSPEEIVKITVAGVGIWRNLSNYIA